MCCVKCSVPFGTLKVQLFLFSTPNRWRKTCLKSLISLFCSNFAVQNKNASLLL